MSLIIDINKSDRIKIEIMKYLSDFKEHTPSEIGSVLHTNGKTILSNCYFLKLLGILNIDIKNTKRTQYYIKLNYNITINDLAQILMNIKKEINQ